MYPFFTGKHKSRKKPSWNRSCIRNMNSLTTLTRFWPFLTTCLQPMLTFVKEFFNVIGENLHIIDIFRTTYLPRLFNVVCEGPLNFLPRFFYPDFSTLIFPPWLINTDLSILIFISLGSCSRIICVLEIRVNAKILPLWPIAKGQVLFLPRFFNPNFSFFRFLLRDYMCIGVNAERIATVTHCQRASIWNYDPKVKLVKEWVAKSWPYFSKIFHIWPYNRKSHELSAYGSKIYENS